MTEPNPITWQTLTTDVLIVGGGTAGCFAAATLGANPDVSVLIAEKANITRSGCLAAGVNALNAYITEGHDPAFYVDYCLRDADGIAREIGSPRSANVVLVGALSTALPFSVDEWEDAVRRRVPPKTIDANLAAFRRGREAAGK